MLFTCFHFNLPHVALVGGRKCLRGKEYYKVSCCTCVCDSPAWRSEVVNIIFHSLPWLPFFYAASFLFKKRINMQRSGLFVKASQRELVLYFRVLLKATHKARRMFRKTRVRKNKSKKKASLDLKHNPKIPNKQITKNNASMLPSKNMSSFERKVFQGCLTSPTRLIIDYYRPTPAGR